MTGTIEDIKKAQKIITKARNWEYPKVCVNLQTDVR